MSSKEEMVHIAGMEKHLANIINSTIETLRKVYPNGARSSAFTCASRIIFPDYSDKATGETRISEQEFRFTFVETFTQYCNANRLDYKYSVETPTNGKYNFTDKDNPKIDENGQSGNMDLVIHGDDGRRLCLIEFKANNPEPFEIEKDLVKLTNREEFDKKVREKIPRYFLHLVKSSKPSSTKQSIQGKLDDIKKKKKDKLNSETVHYKCYNIENGSLLFEEEFEFQSEKTYTLKRFTAL